MALKDVIRGIDQKKEFGTRVVQLISSAVHMGHEIFPVFLSAGTDPHIAQADIRQIDRPHGLIGTNHFFNRWTSEILHRKITLWREI